MCYIGQYPKLPVGNKNKELLIHLENNAKSHENNIFSDKEESNKLNEDTAKKRERRRE